VALNDFRLCANQTDNSFVTVLADDDKVRVVCRLSQADIEDSVGGNPSPEDRKRIVSEGLERIGAVLSLKYEAKEYVPYIDRFGISNEYTVEVALGLNDLSGCNLAWQKDA